MMLILGLFCSFLIVASQAELQLELSSVVFRHGDRSPIRRFPTDQYYESDWPQGFGQLSIVGMQQHEQLGGLFRTRYVTDTYPNFLNSNYTRVQVTVRSTDVDRTLMSVSTMLSALYPPDQDQRFNDSLAWQPIPIHTVATDNDHLLRGYNNCPAYTKLTDADQFTEEYRRIEAENKEFFAMLERETGLDTVDLTNIWSIEDSVFIESVTAGKQPPSWATSDVMSKLKELSDYSLSLMFNTPQKNRLSAGVWLDKLLGDMRNKANGTDTSSKLFLYSAHDTTVACMLSALQLYNRMQPPYASAFLVELFSNTSNKHYYVKFSLRVGPNSTVFESLEMDSCADKGMCTLEEFAAFVSPLIPDDIQQECFGSNDSAAQYRRLSVAFGVVATGLVIMIVLLIIALVIARWRIQKYTYDIFEEA